MVKRLFLKKELGFALYVQSSFFRIRSIRVKARYGSFDKNTTA